MPLGHDRLAGILRGYERRFASTLDEAIRDIQANDFSVVVAAMQFDDSRVSDLLGWIRSQERYGALPIACVAKSFTGRRARAAGADALIDLREFPDDHHGDRAIRRIFDDLVENRRQHELQRAGQEAGLGVG